MSNYFNSLPFRKQRDQLGQCRFMQREEFSQGCDVLKGKSIVIVGCGAQGLNQGLNMRDSGLNVSYALRQAAITEKRDSFKRASDNGFTVGTVHPENDPQGEGLEIAKALASATGGDRAGVLESSFVAEVKSDLMGEQTILCGMQQAAAIVGYDKMVADGTDPAYAAALIQYGLEAITEALKIGGVTNMMDRLSNPAKIEAFELSEKLTTLFRPLFEKHQDDIISGEFSRTMMEDWANDDANLFKWREETGQSGFENAPVYDGKINDQDFFDKGILIVAMIKSGVELAFDVMVEAGILPESAYYESLHETPLISNTIARKRLYEMNVVISDTAEYGNYLFANKAVPLLQEHVMPTITKVQLGEGVSASSNAVDNKRLVEVNKAIRGHGVESIGDVLRGYMTDMKAIVEN